MRSAADVSGKIDHPAEAAGLTYVPSHALPIRRRRCGTGFIYVGAGGRRIIDGPTLARIRSLAIQPAYTDVRISDDPDAHLQATGIDDAGRVQYRYHPGWEAVREQEKLDRLARLVQAISRIRARVARDLQAPEGSKTHALAAVVLLLDRTHIRIGSEDYVHTGRSRGAATLLKRQVQVEGDTVCLEFRAKGGHWFSCAVDSPDLADAIRTLGRLPGARLFQYRSEGGRIRRITSNDVNAYLRKLAGAPVSAKDLRMLAANAAAGLGFTRMEPAPTPTQQRRQVADVIRAVSEMLGNTPAVCRRSYVHAQVVAAFVEGRLARLYARARPGGRRSRGEALVAVLVAGRRRRRGKAAP